MTDIAACTRRLRTTLALSLVIAAGAAFAQEAPPPQNSPLDAPLFYQLLIGELELASGRAGNAYEVILDAARRHGDEELFQRATDIALQAHAGDQALAAARAWRSALPRSVAAMRYETQILLALNRADESAEPLAAWLAAVPVVERPSLIANLPRLLQRMPDRRQALALIERLVAPYRDASETRVASRVAIGGARLAAGDAANALTLASEAAALDPAAPGPALLALDMLPATPAAETIVSTYLARPDADAGLRLAYVRLLIQQQRYAEALPQLEQLTRDRPQLADTWLTLGAMRLELRQPQEAEAALLHYLELAPAAEAANPHDGEAQALADGGQTSRGVTQAWLLLSQAAEMRGDIKGAEAWLAKIDNPRQALEVQTRRASLLMRQGQVKAARALIQSVPERNEDDARAKVLAEAQLLRDAKLWREAARVLADASKRFVDDADLLYEQAMVEEKLDHFDEMERLLRHVIQIKPDHPHAHNALGYSLADRNLRLPEARDLIRQALTLSPGDPFITDSMGWVEFRLGNQDEALRLLRQAYRARPDTEIAAHLGEVLWTSGQHDEARRIWLEGRVRDAANEVLRETLTRLKVRL
jgi:tetratricopeptide (TPR) repeat protein